MSRPLNESLVPAIVTLLKQQLATTLAALNSAGRPNGIPLLIPDVRDIFDYVPSPGDLATWPAVGVSDAVARWEDDAGAFATGVYRQLVVCHLAAPDTSELAWQIRGYGRAFAALFQEATALQALDPTVVQVRRVHWAPGQTLEREENPRTWRTYAGLLLECRVDEDG